MSILNAQSTIEIGPIQFTHQVQDISIQEEKSVSLLAATRVSKNFIADSGISRQKAIVRLLITGIEEINNELRKLIVLFRSCPVISVYNELISTSWPVPRVDEFHENVTDVKEGQPIIVQESSKFKPKRQSGYIPVALEDLVISSVPDIPYAFFVTVTMARVDVSCMYPEGELLYQKERIGDSSPYPVDAFYLIKWLDLALKQDLVPLLFIPDFQSTKIDWYGEYGTAEEIDPKDPTLRTLTFDGVGSKVQSESCSIKNIFSFKNLLGKTVPFVQHMGSTSKYYSMDILFFTQDNNKDFETFCNFKESSDLIAKATERYVRATGWSITSPLTKLISEPSTADSNRQGQPRNNAFVPIHVSIDTADQPKTKAVRLDLAETNTEYYTEFNMTLLSGGTDYTDLKNYYEKIVKGEYLFRLLFSKKNSIDLAKGLSGNDPLYADIMTHFETFWPVINGNLDFSYIEKFGVLNRDVLKAIILSPSFDPDQKLAIALEGTPIISGGYNVAEAKRLPGLFTRIIENIKLNNQAVLGASESTYQDVYFIIREYVISMFKADVAISLDKNADIINGNFFENIVPDAQGKDYVDIVSDGNGWYRFGQWHKTPQGIEQPGIGNGTLQAGPSPEFEDAVTEIASKLFTAMFGEYTSIIDFSNASGEAVSMLSKSKFEFSKKFTDALFEVIVKREPLGRQALDKTYDMEGIYSAFFKLLLAYSGDSSYLESSKKDQTSTSLNAYFNRSVYEDLHLPKYIELYGDNWKEFAPIYDDLGIVNSASSKKTNNEEDLQAVLAVDENDTVPPSAWFYNKKYKPKLHEEIDLAGKTTYELSTELHFSMPFEVDDLEEIERLTTVVNDSSVNDEDKKQAKEALHRRISKNFDAGRINYSDQYEQFLEELTLYGPSLSKYEKTFNPDDKIAFYVHHMGSPQRKKYLSVPGATAEIYKFANQLRIIKPNDRFPVIADSGFKSAESTNKFEFIRSLRENNQACLKSAIKQIPEVYESSIKMFPAIKIYLLDQRGTDLYGDDTFFTVNPIISVDITSDKDDADLAVIQIADPLHVLQASFFPGGGVAEVKGQDGSVSKRVIGNLKGTNVEGYLKRFKITEGRAVQIRLGYDSMPKNLKTVFTGRIVEISPGDVLTLVCQGWKTELINRQVNFYNDNVKNWGARDLAIMTMQKANPDGFGDVIPQMTSDYVLKTLNPNNIGDIIEQIRNNQEGVDTTTGQRGFFNNWGSAIKEFFGLETTAKTMQGLDTRLKNIWWPDLASHNNFVGWRNWTEVMPSQINDSWIVPLQPSWEVFKEASRHAWNSVVSVVPFDGRATLFFGHPDLPYYFTKGGPQFRQRLQNYKKVSDKLNTSFDIIALKFLASKFYDSKVDVSDYENAFSQKAGVEYAGSFEKSVQAESITDNDVFFDMDRVYRGLPEIIGYPPKKDINSYKTTETLLKNKESYIAYFDSTYSDSKSYTVDTYASLMNKIVDNSSLPSRAFEEIQDRYGSNTIPLLMYLMYTISPKNTRIYWPSSELDLPRLLSPASQISKEESEILKEKINNIPLEDLDLAIDNLYKAGYQPTVTSAPISYLGLPIVNTFSGTVAILGQRDVYKNKIFSKKARLVLDKIKEGSPAKFVNIARDVVDLYSRIEDTVIEIFNEIPEAELEKLNYYLPSYSLSQSAPQKNMQISHKLTPRLLNYTKNVFGYFEQLRDIASSSSKDENLLDPFSIKLFVVYFNEFLKDRDTDTELKNTNEDLRGNQGVLPPNMQVFRQHHWIDNDHDIIQNQIVSSTKDMWNTVAIERPAHADAISKVTDEALFKASEYYSGLNWVYWPKKEISGVVGLQFHPGLTLADKKIKVFTELNCQSDELAAKLACTHLADGLRRMYRGNLLVLGRIAKPHDRILLKDDYTNMTGPLEIESVVHHWSVDTGWVTSIAPQASCDANPGAAIIQTAALEDTFNKVFKAVDFVSDAITVAIIIASLGTGAGAGAVVGQGLKGIAAGVIGTLRQVLSKNVNKFAVNRIKAGLFNAGLISGQIGRGIIQGNLPFQLGRLVRQFGGVGSAFLKNYANMTVINLGVYSAYRLMTTTSYVDAAQKAEQLPVILNPLTFNGLPFIAGLNTDDPIWLVGSQQTFWNFRAFNKGAEQVIQSIFGPNYVQQFK